MIDRQQIVAARMLAGWSQEKLADEADISVAAVKAIESGRNRPREKTLKLIENAWHG